MWSRAKRTKTPGGDEVDHERQDVLVAVEALERLEAQGAEQPHDEHPLGGAEVPAVDAGEEDARGHGRGVPTGRRLTLALRVHVGLDARTGDDEDECDEDEDRHDGPEGRRRQDEQQTRPDDRADERHRHEAAQRRRLSTELVPVAPGPGHATRDETDVVRDVGDERVDPEEEQRGERDERARTDDRVDDPGPRAGQGDG